MKVWNPGASDDKFELTSMIDVVFLLIAFFMTVTSFASSELIQVKMPVAPQATVPEDIGNRQFLSISENGTYFLGGVFLRPARHNGGARKTQGHGRF